MSRATKQQLRLDAAKYIILFFSLKKKRLIAWESWAGQNMSHLDYSLGFFGLGSCGMLGDMAWLLILSGRCQEALI